MMNFSHERPIVRLNNFILDLSKSTIKGQVHIYSCGFTKAKWPNNGAPWPLPKVFLLDRLSIHPIAFRFLAFSGRSLFSNVLWKLGSSARYLKVLWQVYNLSPSLNRH
ncbi:hypothetical protein Peur_046142 [Populus x canadensis]